MPDPGDPMTRRMMKRRWLTCLLFLLASFFLSGQITFEEIVEAASRQDSEIFSRESLLGKGYFPERIQMEYESWGYNLDSGRALHWMHITRNENSSINKVQFISWGHEIHATLVEAIVKNCKYRRVNRHYEGTYYMTYQYEDLLEFDIWEGEKDGIDYFIIDIYFRNQQ